MSKALKQVMSKKRVKKESNKVSGNIKMKVLLKLSRQNLEDINNAILHNRVYFIKEFFSKYN
jgi:hypothetical protein